MTEITQEDLLRFLYGETSDKKSAAINAAMKDDVRVKETLEQLKSTQKALDSMKQNPSAECINRILEYGKRKQESRVQTH